MITEDNKVSTIIYIVVRHFQYGHIVESIWTTMELALSAIHYHAHSSNLPIERYSIIERELNKAKRI